MENAEQQQTAAAAPLALVTRPAGFIAPAWTAEREAILRSQIAPPSASKAEVDYFVAWAKRTGLDPFLKQAYLIERGSNQNGTWVTKHEPMASVAGLAARADAEPDFMGMRSGAVFSGDIFEVDPSAGTVTHRWTLETRAKAGNKLIGAWAHAARSGRQIPITFLTLESRIQLTREGKPTKFWATMPAGQIVKCAEAEQYRRAYANLLGGAYIREELPDEDPDAPAPASALPPVSRTASVLAKVQAVVASGAAAPPVPTPPPANTTPSGETTAAPAPKRAADLSAGDLGKALDHYRHKLAARPVDPQAPQWKAKLDLLESELAAREAALGAAPVGSDSTEAPF